MNETTKLPPEMRFKLYLGTLLMSVGALVMIFVDSIFVGVILLVAGSAIQSPVCKYLKRVRPSLTMAQRKKRFALAVAVFTVGWVICPFLLHW